MAYNLHQLQKLKWVMEQEDRKYKATFRPTAATARLHRRPLRARSEGGSPSTQQRPAAAVRG
jgi:hypothetical protein